MHRQTGPAADSLPSAATGDLQPRLRTRAPRLIPDLTKPGLSQRSSITAFSPWRVFTNDVPLF